MVSTLGLTTSRKSALGGSRLWKILFTPMDWIKGCAKVSKPRRGYPYFKANAVPFWAEMFDCCESATEAKVRSSDNLFMFTCEVSVRRQTSG